MKLTIKHYPKLERPWLLKREHGDYDQHAHFYTEKEAKCCRRLIDQGRYPYEKKYKIAMKRLLSEEEFKALRKKQRYFNSQKGVHRS